jgi:hypothetical protein
MVFPLSDLRPPEGVEGGIVAAVAPVFVVVVDERMDFKGAAEVVVVVGAVDEPSEGAVVVVNGFEVSVGGAKKEKI